MTAIQTMHHGHVRGSAIVAVDTVTLTVDGATVHRVRAHVTGIDGPVAVKDYPTLREARLLERALVRHLFCDPHPHGSQSTHRSPSRFVDTPAGPVPHGPAGNPDPEGALEP